MTSPLPRRAAPSTSRTIPTELSVVLEQHMVNLTDRGYTIINPRGGDITREIRSNSRAISRDWDRWSRRNAHKLQELE